MATLLWPKISMCSQWAFPTCRETAESVPSLKVLTLCGPSVVRLYANPSPHPWDHKLLWTSGICQLCTHTFKGPGPAGCGGERRGSRYVPSYLSPKGAIRRLTNLWFGRMDMPGAGPGSEPGLSSLDVSRELVCGLWRIQALGFVKHWVFHFVGDMELPECPGGS